MGKRYKKAVIAVAALIAIAVAVLAGVNAYVIGIAKPMILSAEQATHLEDVDCILVLGCGVNQDNTPSDMLADRLSSACALYAGGAAPKLLMSGDHSRKDYDEVSVMKQYAAEKGIPTEDIFMDHAGFSTYESLYRAKEIFQAERVVVVTQEYHLYRALFIAEQLGLQAYGVARGPKVYQQQAYYEAREAVARCKDFFYCFFKPEPTFLGDAIPVSGNGNLTNDLILYD